MDLVQILRHYKLSGGKQEHAQQTLEHLRSTINHEEQEDKILELMDFVAGFCSPHMSIW